MSVEFLFMEKPHTSLDLRVWRWDLPLKAQIDGKHILWNIVYPLWLDIAKKKAGITPAFFIMYVSRY